MGWGEAPVPGGRLRKLPKGMSDEAETIRRRVADPARLAAVRATGLLDTPAEEPFDRLARLAAVALEAPLAFVTVVDENRSFWKACIGMDARDPADRQNTVAESFCQYVVGSDAELVVGDAASDPRTRENPSIAGMGVAAWAGFPLRAPGGEVLGSFCVVDTEVRKWTERDVEILRTLAHAAGGEIALRAAAEQSAALAHTLQQTLLPPVLPSVPGMEVGAVYRAAGQGTEVLGDFYDVFESADDRWNVVLGDVCGKGVAAARMTGLARYTVRAGAMRERLPSRVLRLLDHELRRENAGAMLFVTAVLVMLDRDGSGVRATMSSGGHVPVVVRSADGCRVIETPGSLLGVLDSISLTDTEFVLAPDDLLVLCTDGVTEARNGREQFGMQRLVEVVAGAPAGAPAVVEAINDAIIAFSGPTAQDDVAILALRVAG